MPDMVDVSGANDELDMLRLSLRNTAARLEHATAVQERSETTIRELLNELSEARDERTRAVAAAVEASRRAEAAEARLQAVRTLHVGVEIEDFPICRACDAYWPCSTWHALDSSSDG